MTWFIRSLGNGNHSVKPECETPAVAAGPIFYWICGLLIYRKHGRTKKNECCNLHSWVKLLIVLPKEDIPPENMPLMWAMATQENVFFLYYLHCFTIVTQTWRNCHHCMHRSALNSDKCWSINSNETVQTKTECCNTQHLPATNLHTAASNPSMIFYLESTPAPERQSGSVKPILIIVHYIIIAITRIRSVERGICPIAAICTVGLLFYCPDVKPFGRSFRCVCIALSLAAAKYVCATFSLNARNL